MDKVIIKKKRIAELVQNFRDLMRENPVRVNDFIQQAKFPLNAFYFKTEEAYVSMTEFVWNPNEKQLRVRCQNIPMAAKIKDLHVVCEKVSNDYGCLDGKIQYYYTSEEDREDLERSIKARYGNDYELGDIWFQYVLDFLTIEFVVGNLQSVVKQRKEKEETIVESGKGINKRYKKVINFCTCHYIDDVYIKKNDIRHFLITCPAWGVRGHYRHYQNGKIGYVKPYVKGKERKNADKYVDKTYILGGKENEEESK